ncbi:MAG: hypothetical protein CFE29_22790 [Bradyrhizobiaceae bacterium PARB1]|nr:MAG: hypothetical protein CFE29_22790 [Bradyrhizobiaceae bacterium PARB1]
MEKSELLVAAAQLTGSRSLKDMTLDEVERLVTVAQYVFDICLNELDDRGELRDSDGCVSVPYVCDYIVWTALTRRSVKADNA